MMRDSKNSHCNTRLQKKISKHKGVEIESLFTYLFHNIGLMSLCPEFSPKKISS